MRVSFVWYLLGSVSLLFSGEEEYITTKTFEKAADKSFYVSFNSLRPEEVQEGEIVHINREVSQFFVRYHPYIRFPYILVSHHNTRSIVDTYIPFLEDERLMAWFAQNIEIAHPKLNLIPLGLNDLHGQVEILDQCRKRIPQLPKQHLLYMNFSTMTCPKERKKVFTLFVDQPYCYTSDFIPYEEYLIDLASSKFVLSPRGMGLDCFRTWESLYMRAIPIVRSSPIDPLFEGLPVLIVDEWEEISEEFLIQKYEEMRTAEYRWEKLTSQYWIDLIRSFKDS